jgi:hypothetical protein
VIDHWTRKAATGDHSWESYWETLHAPHRTALVEALRRLPPFATLLEVGCGPGVNLWRVREAFPHITVGGFDVSPQAIESGHQRFTAAEGNGQLLGAGDVYLAVGSLPDALQQVEPPDVVLSCYSCAYVRPAQFHETMLALTTVARRAIVLAEPMVVVGDPPGLSQLLRRNPDEFKHDYLSWFRVCAPTWSVSMKPLQVQHMNRILVARAGA